MRQIYWVYILNCDNGTFYTGITTDLSRRYNEHAQGTSKCKYTRSFKPVSLAQSWQITNGKRFALKIEYAIKQMSKKRKQELILFPERLFIFIASKNL